MISHEHKCIFIHIPKTAGSSVEKKLGLYDTPSWDAQDHRTIRDIQPITLAVALKLLRNPRRDLSRLSAIRAFFRPYHQHSARVPYKLYRSYLKFTIVRNPWARVHSWYRNVMEDPRHGIPPCSFKTFVENHGDEWALLPQTFWLLDYDGNIAVDEVVKFENLDNEMPNILRRLGFTDTTLPHILNSTGTTSGDKSFKNAYDQYTKQIIARRYRKEIELFGYAFE